MMNIDGAKICEKIINKYAMKKVVDMVFANNGDGSIIFIDQGSEVLDHHCMMIELILHGLDFFDSKIKLFDIDSFDHPVVNFIKNKIMKLNVEIILENISCPKNPHEYYCQIVPKPPDHVCCESYWCVLSYRMIKNKKPMIANLNLDNYSSFFKTKNGKFISIKFKYI